LVWYAPVSGKLIESVKPATTAEWLASTATDYANFLDNTQGKLFRLQTIDVQSSTLHSTPGYDDETGVGTPHGPAFFLGALIRSRH
jgi:hypothetical protein